MNKIQFMKKGSLLKKQQFKAKGFWPFHVFAQYDINHIP